MTYLGNQLSSQQEANEMIRAENTRLDGVNKEIETLETQRDEMVSRMKVIQDLQGRRSVPVRVWDDIARAVPSNMYLVSMKREGDTITINGFADNNNVISQLVRNLDASPWLANSLIPQIKTKVQAYETAASANAKSANQGQEGRGVLPEDGYVEFTVTTQVKADEPKAEGEAGATTPADAQTSAPAVETAPVPTAPAPTPPPANATLEAPANNAAPTPVAGTPAPVAEPQQGVPVPAGDPKPVIADTTGAPPPTQAPQAPQPATDASQNQTSTGGQ